ncbi:hypothetical protein E8E11_000706 [Didymella keratinophila]|nr:hypothetical protein E8E11_000706 [Didymella keratinophila]
MKYFPEDEHHVKRGLDIMERLRHERPVGMKKMSTDEGEMFMLDDWIFAPSQSKRSEYEDFGNGTYQVQPPIRPNAGDEWLERMRIRDVLLKRQCRCWDVHHIRPAIHNRSPFVVDYSCRQSDVCLELGSTDYFSRTLVHASAFVFVIDYRIHLFHGLVLMPGWILSECVVQLSG